MRPSSENGLIAILLDESDQGGDFLALVIIEGVVQLRFDLGKFWCNGVQIKHWKFFHLSYSSSRDIVSQKDYLNSFYCQGSCSLENPSYSRKDLCLCPTIFPLCTRGKTRRKVFPEVKMTKRLPCKVILVGKIKNLYGLVSPWIWCYLSRRIAICPNRLKTYNNGRACEHCATGVFKE